MYLLKVISLQVKYAILTAECKVAKLKPLFKEEQNRIFISPLPSKINQKWSCNWVQVFLTEKYPLHAHQSSFRTNYVTYTCLSQLYDVILNNAEKDFDIGHNFFFYQNEIHLFTNNIYNIKTIKIKETYKT